MTDERKAKMVKDGGDCDWSWFGFEGEEMVVRISANVGFSGWEGE